MKHSETSKHENYPDIYHDAYSRTTFGFWLYLLTDFVLFGALFATYAVLRNSTFGGPSARELFDASPVLTQTLILLACSFTSGIAGAAAHRNDKRITVLMFLITFVLGTLFMQMEFSEFSRLIQAGNSLDKSAFLSAYFTLVGTHGLHVIFGLLWILVLLIPIWREGISVVSIRRLTCLRMFWQFLNVVWVFIFTFVYLLGGVR